MPNINYNAALPTLPLASQQALDISEWLNNLNTPTFDQQILKLFANNEQGFFYDPNDLSTMFQDAAGTIPVTAAGQPVGLIRDKSGRNNHAFQTTSAARPILRQNAVTGANYLEFDGVDDFLITVSFPAMGLGTTIFSGSLCNKSSTSAIVARGVGGYIFQTSGSTQVQSLNNTIVISINGNTVATALYDPSGTGVTLQANSQTTTNPIIERGFNVSNPLIIGAFNSSGVALFRGNIYSLIGINRVATTPEITNIRNAIAKRLGVTL